MIWYLILTGLGAVLFISPGLFFALVAAAILGDPGKPISRILGGK